MEYRLGNGKGGIGPIQRCMAQGTDTRTSPKKTKVTNTAYQRPGQEERHRGPFSCRELSDCTLRHMSRFRTCCGSVFDYQNRLDWRRLPDLPPLHRAVSLLPGSDRLLRGTTRIIHLRKASCSASSPVEGSGVRLRTHYVDVYHVELHCPAEVFSMGIQRGCGFHPAVL